MMTEAEDDQLSAPEGWECPTLTALADEERGITYGIVQPGQHVIGGVPIVRVQNIVDGTLETSDIMRVAPEIAAKYQRTRLRGGELLLSLVGSVGSSVIAPPEVAGWNTARAVAVVPLRAGIDPRWVRFCLRSAPLQHLMEAWCNTTVQATLNLKDVCRLPIPLPPAREREAIVAVLGSLDDKIELNRRTNRTLEELAAALFRSWFVDFDPVVAKAAGRAPFGLSARIAALFSNTFTGSELGPIPHGWRVESIYTAADVIYGAPFASAKFNTVGIGKPLIRIRDLPDDQGSVFTPEEHPKGSIVRAGDIVVGMDGEFRAYLWGGEESWLNQRLCLFRPKTGFSTPFVRLAITAPLADVEATELATTVIHLGKQDIDRFRFVRPQCQILTQFNSVAEPWYHQIVHNRAESRTLSKLRDTLLPKLLSGELRVKDAEKKVATAV